MHHAPTPTSLNPPPPPRVWQKHGHSRGVWVYPHVLDGCVYAACTPLRFLRTDCLLPGPAAREQLPVTFRCFRRLASIFIFGIWTRRLRLPILTTHLTWVTLTLHVIRKAGRFCTHWRHHPTNLHANPQQLPRLYSSAKGRHLQWYGRPARCTCHPHVNVPPRRRTPRHACWLGLGRAGRRGPRRAPTTLGRHRPRP